MVPLRPLSSRLFPDAPPAALSSGDTTPLTLESIVVEPVSKGLEASKIETSKLEPLPSSFWETAETTPHSTSSPVPPPFTSPFTPVKFFEEDLPSEEVSPPESALAEIHPPMEEDDLGPPSAASVLASPFQISAPAVPAAPAAPITTPTPAEVPALEIPSAEIDELPPLPALPALPPLPPAAPASLASVLAAVVASSPVPLTLPSVLPTMSRTSVPPAPPLPELPSLPSQAMEASAPLATPVSLAPPASHFSLPKEEAPAVPPVAAGRAELAAVQEMLFDINLAVSRRKEELEDLEQKATAAREVIARAEEAKVTLDTLHAEMEAAQTKALAEQESLQATLEGLRAEHSSLSLQSADLTEKVAAYQNQESQLKTTVATLTKDLEADQAERTAVRAELDRITGQLADDRADWQRQETEAAARLATLQTDASLASDALQRVKDQLSETQIRHEALHRTATEHSATVSGLEEKLTQLTAETTTLETSLRARTAELEEVSRQLEDRQRSIALTESESRAREEILAQRCHELEAAADKASALLAASGTALAENRARQQELEQACQESDRRRAAWETEQDALTKELAALKAETATQTEALAKTRQELSKQEDALQVLRDDTTQAEKEHASRRAVLEEELTTLTANHARAEQALAATRSRHEALLLKQDEALAELERRQEIIAGLTARETALSAKLNAAETADVQAPPAVTAEDKAALEKLRAETAALETAVLTKTRQQEILEKELQETEATLAKLRQTLTEELEAQALRQQQMQADAAAAEAAALETAVLTKARQQETLEKELQETEAALAKLRQTLTEEQEAHALRQQQMQADSAAAEAAAQASREAMQKEQTFQQDLANRHTAALNDLDAVKANVDSLRREADELQATIRQRNSQKDSLAEELRRTKAALDALPSAGQDEPSSTSKPFSEAAQEKTIMDLIRLVDATDSAHAMICQAAPGGMTTSQFTLLRESVTGILKNLGVKEFGVAPGTEVDDNIRRQIQVVKNLNGNATPCIQTVLSSGFVLDPGNGQYTFLRKPEVIVSSEGV